MITNQSHNKLLRALVYSMKTAGSHEIMCQIFSTKKASFVIVKDTTTHEVFKVLMEDYEENPMQVVFESMLHDKRLSKNRIKKI